MRTSRQSLFGCFQARKKDNDGLVENKKEETSDRRHQQEEQHPATMAAIHEEEKQEEENGDEEDKDPATSTIRSSLRISKASSIVALGYAGRKLSDMFLKSANDTAIEDLILCEDDLVAGVQQLVAVVGGGGGGGGGGAASSATAATLTTAAKTTALQSMAVASAQSAASTAAAASSGLSAAGAATAATATTTAVATASSTAAVGGSALGASTGAIVAGATAIAVGAAALTFLDDSGKATILCHNVQNPSFAVGLLNLDFIVATDHPTSHDRLLTNQEATVLAEALSEAYNDTNGCNHDFARLVASCFVPCSGVLDDDHGDASCCGFENTELGMVIRCPFNCTVHCEGCSLMEPLFSMDNSSSNAIQNDDLDGVASHTPSAAPGDISNQPSLAPGHGNSTTNHGLGRQRNLLQAGQKECTLIPCQVASVVASSFCENFPNASFCDWSRIETLEVPENLIANGVQVEIPKERRSSSIWYSRRWWLSLSPSASPAATAIPTAIPLEPEPPSAPHDNDDDQDGAALSRESPTLALFVITDSDAPAEVVSNAPSLVASSSEPTINPSTDIPSQRPTSNDRSTLDPSSRHASLSFGPTILTMAEPPPTPRPSTQRPSVNPSEEPTTLPPSEKPTQQPSSMPTMSPSWQPTLVPVSVLSTSPTVTPTAMPSIASLNRRQVRVFALLRCIISCARNECSCVSSPSQTTKAPSAQTAPSPTATPPASPPMPRTDIFPPPQVPFPSFQPPAKSGMAMRSPAPFLMTGLIPLDRPTRPPVFFLPPLLPLSTPSPFPAPKGLPTRTKTTLRPRPPMRSPPSTIDPTSDPTSELLPMSLILLTPAPSWNSKSKATTSTQTGGLFPTAEPTHGPTPVEKLKIPTLEPSMLPLDVPFATPFLARLPLQKRASTPVASDRRFQEPLRKPP